MRWLRLAVLLGGWVVFLPYNLVLARRYGWKLLPILRIAIKWELSR